VKKCPYCDFNSHAWQSEARPGSNAYYQHYQHYVEQLCRDLQQDCARYTQHQPRLHTIFFGGGTPSLCPPELIATCITAVKQCFPQQHELLEITLEANPGTIDSQNLAGYAAAGVNRLSIGVQSLQAAHLQRLGRVHSVADVYNTVEQAHAVFSNINLDLMFALPAQTTAEAIEDLTQALTLQPQHLSWYQLTIEANTAFAKRPPLLPESELAWEMQTQGQQLLQQHGFHQYEVSAFALTPAYQCHHNLNYWHFGDYLGIGAGAHAKISQQSPASILRLEKHASPKLYGHPNFTSKQQWVGAERRAFEFMLGALRLHAGFPKRLFSERTGLHLNSIEAQLTQGKQLGLLSETTHDIQLTSFGKNFLNDAISLFL
jgi:putative oxygen-independent coproporphyrinogen III oxidase